MEFMEEFKELYHKGEKIMQKMQGDNYGQRRYRYGMRDGHDGYGGGYGQRWDGPMQGNYPPMQGGFHSQYPDINPMMFM